LCHRSWCAEHAGYESNERLEFLGDAVLGLIVAEHVFTSFPDNDEGWLSRARSSVVRASALAEMASEAGLGESLQLGKGEDSSGGRQKPSILADAFEAVIGAVYLDGGWEAAKALVLRALGDRVAAPLDDKSRLQEFASRRVGVRPRYLVEETGPEHDKEFRAQVLLDGDLWGEGDGRSKKQAELLAARAALARLHVELGPDDDRREPDGHRTSEVPGA
jgi:ribonuclease-3